MSVGTRHLWSCSHVGQLRLVRTNEFIVFSDSYGRDVLGYLRPGDLVSVVGYDYKQDELQVLTRLGVGWMGPHSVQFTEMLSVPQ